MKRILSVALSIILAFAVVIPMTSCGRANSTQSSQFVREDVVVRNFVDERFEFVALAARIAGFAHHSLTTTDYHRRLDAAFLHFQDHEAIQAVFTLHGWMDIFSFASILEITEDGFALRDLNTYRSDMQLRHDYNRLQSLVNYLNVLHRDTNFRAFFNNEENQRYFMRISTDFVQNVYRYINFEWFEQFGFDPDNMHVILMPSLVLGGGIGQWIFDEDYNLKIAYSILGPGSMTNYITTIHEFAHAFANPLAAQWHSSCLDFWALTRETHQRGFVDPAYATTRIVAYEYVTRAFTILYFADNSDRNIQALFQIDRMHGFRNIREVFDMLMRYLGRYELIQLS